MFYEIHGLGADDNALEASFVGKEVVTRKLKRANDEVEEENVAWDKFLGIATPAGFDVLGEFFVWMRARGNYIVNRDSIGRASHETLKTRQGGQMESVITYRRGRDGEMTDVGTW